MLSPRRVRPLGEQRPTSNEEDILLLPMLPRGRQTLEARGEKNDEPRMTNDEGMMQLKWSFPAPAHAHNPNRGQTSEVRGHTSDVSFASQLLNYSTSQRFRHMMIEVIATAVGPALVTPS